MQVEVDSDMIDAVFRDWPRERGELAMKLLDVFLIHGADPGLARLKVSELFSPPRVTALLGTVPDLSALAPGSTFDLRMDRNGKSWDFLRADHRREVRRRIEQEDPYLVVGSPPCTDFSILFKNLNSKKMDPTIVTQRRIKAEVLLRFACEVYEAQMARGRHFLHEHLVGADSWQTQWVQRLRQDARVSEVIAHQCMLGQTTMGPDGSRLPVLKPTRFLSSAPALLDELNRNCSRDHLHHPLLGRSRAAEYPAELCMAILKGIDAQRLREGLGPPQPALRALRLGVGLYDLSPDVSPPC